VQVPKYEVNFTVNYEMLSIFDDELKKELSCYISKSISFYITQHEDCLAPVKFTDAAATHKERLVMAIRSSHLAKN